MYRRRDEIKSFSPGYNRSKMSRRFKNLNFERSAAYSFLSSLSLASCCASLYLYLFLFLYLSLSLCFSLSLYIWADMCAKWRCLFLEVGRHPLVSHETCFQRCIRASTCYFRTPMSNLRQSLPPTTPRSLPRPCLFPCLRLLLTPHCMPWLVFGLSVDCLSLLGVRLGRDAPEYVARMTIEADRRSVSRLIPGVHVQF